MVAKPKNKKNSLQKRNDKSVIIILVGLTVGKEFTSDLSEQSDCHNKNDEIFWNTFQSGIIRFQKNFHTFKYLIMI